MRELVTSIDLWSNVQVTRKKKEMSAAVQFSMEKALEDLVTESKIREADIKIAHMKKVLAILKS